MTQPYSDAIARFWSSNPSGPMLVEAFELSHPALGVSHITNFGRALEATLETAELVTLYPVAFSLVEPQRRSGTEQELIVSVDGYEGELYRALRTITPGARLTPLDVIYRQWLDTDLSAPVNAPPPRFEVRQINAETGKLTIHAVARNLVSRSAGLYYTLDRFPSLERA